MIKKENIQFLSKRYYVPYCNEIKAVTIINLKNDYKALVKCRNETFYMPITYIYETKEEALQEKGSWQMYQQMIRRQEKIAKTISGNRDKL